MNRLSLGVLAIISAMALTGPARAQSPEERADAYIKNELDPDIVAAVFGLSESERENAAKKFKLWRGELRKAIIEYEKSPVTRDAVAACLRNASIEGVDPKHREEWVQTFMQETAPVAGLAPEAQFDGIVEAYLRFNDTVDRANGMRRAQHPPIEITRVRVKDCAAEAAQKRMIWLYNEGQPLKFSRPTYWSYLRSK